MAPAPRPSAAHRRGARTRLAAGAFAAALALSGGTASARSAGVARPVVAQTAETAALTSPHAVVTSLGRRVAGARIVGATRPVTGVQTVLPVVGHGRATDGTRLLRIMLPGRPNGRRGWIRQAGTIIGHAEWSITVRTSEHRVLVYHRGKLRRSFSAVTGKPSTPTPIGEFFVEESVRMPPGAAGGPYALALSARSTVLQTFGGGPGQIAIHGTAKLAGATGTASSHGCVRVGTQDIGWLAHRIPPGTRVAILSS